MQSSTYSFLDLAGVIAHPTYPGGPFQFTGAGLGAGTITITMDTERTAHDVAADGTVMVSKMAGNNGKIQIECQQTSIVHKYLLAMYNWLVGESAGAWAQSAAVLRNVSDGTSHICSGVSFGKKPDKTYAAQGGRVTWTLWAADIVDVNA